MTAPSSGGAPSPSAPVVLCLSGLDGTGGAGLSADIETLIIQSCRCAPVATALTVQDTEDVDEVAPVETGLLLRQARAVLSDIPVDCIKIGLLPAAATVEAVEELLAQCPEHPVVLDPIARASGGRELAGRKVMDAIRRRLLSRTTVLTPNIAEARALVPEAVSLDDCAEALLGLGCGHVLITGADDDTPRVVNRLYSPGRPPMLYDWERLERGHHGSGCTLAAAVAGCLAMGLEDIEEAVSMSQHYVWEALRTGEAVGRGRLLPNRGWLLSGRDEDEEDEDGDGEEA